MVITFIRGTFLGLCAVVLILMAMRRDDRAICDVITLHDHELSQCVNSVVDKCERIYHPSSQVYTACIEGETRADCLWISARIIDLCNAHARQCQKICADIFATV